MYAWTIHLSHPVILCLETSFPHHRSILSTINRSIHRSNHHLPTALYTILFITSAFSSCILGQPTYPIPLLCVRKFHFRTTGLYYRHISSSLDAPHPSPFCSKLSFPLHHYVVPLHIIHRSSTTFTTNTFGCPIHTTLQLTSLATRSLYIFTDALIS